MGRQLSSYEDLRDELQSQISDLGNELRALRKSVSKRSVDRYEDVRDGAGDLFDGIWAVVSDNLPTRKQIHRQARRANRAVYEHPGTSAAGAVFGLAVLGLLAMLLLRR
ncbi:MAG: hypothetical protein ACK4F5_14735 [Aliihoeflea sp.]